MTDPLLRPRAPDPALAEAELARMVELLPPVPDAHDDGGDLGGDLGGDPPRTIADRSVPPDPLDCPRLHEVWRRFWQPLPKVLPVQRRLAPAAHSMAVHAGEGAIGGAGRWGSSRNWSGAVAQARGGGRFRRVVASWAVPAARRPPDAAGGVAPPGGAWQSSVWIGLDGFSLSSLSLPQVGTVSQINADGSAEYYLWVQWWVRGKLFGEVRIPSFPVAAGDTIDAMLEVAGPENVHVFVKNRFVAEHAGPVVVAVDWKAGVFEGDIAGRLGAPEAERQRMMAPVEGRHAVWCVERPSVMPPDTQAADALKRIEPFDVPALEEVVFTDALAELGPPATGPAYIQEIDLSSARLLRRVDTVAGSHPPQVVHASVPEVPAAGGTRLRVRQVARPV